MNGAACLNFDSKERALKLGESFEKATDEDETYEDSLEFRKGGDGHARRSTRPTQQFYQPPRARN